MADHRLFGSLYAAPYGVLEPEHAVVIDGGSGMAIGYAVGALDTRAFEARCETEWWPILRQQHAVGSGGNHLDELLIVMLHHPHHAAGDVVARYPSHLHIDLLPEAQGAGWGRRLMQHLHDALHDDGSRGVHVGVSTRNHRALGFYAHLGYDELSHDTMSHTLGLRL